MEEDFEISALATKYLLQLGFDIRNMGFDYLKIAINICCQDVSYLKAITTKLYPTLANLFNVKPATIERDIRVSIKKAYKNAGLLGMNDIFDAIVYTNDFVYSNSELIGILVNKINYDIKKEKLLKKYKIKK